MTTGKNREHSGAQAARSVHVEEMRREQATVTGYIDSSGDVKANAGSQRAQYVTDVPRNTHAEQYSIARTQTLDGGDSLPWQGREEDQRVGNFPLSGTHWHVGEPIDVDAFRGLSFYIKYEPAQANVTLEYILEVNSGMSREGDFYEMGVTRQCILAQATGQEEKYENTGETSGLAPQDATPGPGIYPGRQQPRLVHDAHYFQQIGARVFRLHNAQESTTRTGVAGDDSPESWGPIRIVMDPFHVSPYKWARLKFREILNVCPPEDGPGTGRLWVAHSRSV